MSRLIVHTSIGYAVTSIGLLVQPKRIGIGKSIFFSLIGAIWAELPDGHNLCPEGPLKEAWLRFHNSPWANICFGHYLLDKIDPEDKPEHATIPVLGAITTSVGFVIREEGKL